MVAGHLSVKHGNYYAVLNYKNAEGKRKTKWISLGLPEKGNKRKAEAELAKLRAEFEVPEEVGDLSSDMLFADYLLEWLEIAKGRLAIATYSSYLGLIKSVIEPYFRKQRLLQTHMSIDSTISSIRSCNPKQTRTIVLIHLSSLNADPDIFQQKVAAAFGIPTYIAKPHTIIKL